jgi:putative hemolysin
LNTGFLLADFFNEFYLLTANFQSSTLRGIGLVILLLFSFTISGAEVALFSLNYKDINVLKTKQHPAARRIINLLEEPKAVFASLLIAGTFINISIIILANSLITQFVLLSNVLLLFIIKVLVIGFLLIFIGKIFPKVWATQNNIRFAFNAAFIIEALHLLLRKISLWMVSLADGIGEKLGANRSEFTNMKDLDTAIDKSGDEDEKNILKGIARFGNITVRQVMRSRLDVTGIEFDTSFGQLIKKVEEHHYSRLPVYKKTLDEVTGLINTKDLIPLLHEPDSYDWRHLMRQPYFVPEIKLVEDLMKEFQSKRIHFAVVVDEFGGTSGIVTMEDLLEEIIGDIKDEFDEDESGNKKIDSFNYLFEGKTAIGDACKMMGMPADTFDKVKEDSESMAGLVLELAGQFPAVDEVINSGDFAFTVTEADKQRITKIKVSIKQKVK